LNLGSKMVLDATRNGLPAPSNARQAGHAAAPVPSFDEDAIRCLHPRIRALRVLEGCLVAVQVEGEGRSVVEALVRADALQAAKLVVVVSSDVELRDRESLLWGIFTRFDPARDVVFAESELHGSWPVYRGCLSIDATFKSGYPDPIVMEPAVVQRVTQRWHHYFSA
ncbi:MAG: UbiD family decarboxylase, partial [Candidatus Omnitrophica bacterium]|nr:UbiD family decarboxylase [Candidatus Omnitrophota bacterium]